MEKIIVSNATVLPVINGPATGGWHNWIIISQTVALLKGNHNFGIYATVAGWILNWFNVVQAIMGSDECAYCAAENVSFTLTGVCDAAYGTDGITFNYATFGDPTPNVVQCGFHRIYELNFGS